VGTDIVGSGTFNATFSLAGVELPPCSGPSAGVSWRNHGQYVSAVAHAVNTSLKAGEITEEQADAIVGGAAESSCGKKGGRERGRGPLGPPLPFCRCEPI